MWVSHGDQFSHLKVHLMWIGFRSTSDHGSYLNLVLFQCTLVHISIWHLLSYAQWFIFQLGTYQLTIYITFQNREVATGGQGGRAPPIFWPDCAVTVTSSKLWRHSYYKLTPQCRIGCYLPVPKDHAAEGLSWKWHFYRLCLNFESFSVIWHLY